MKKNNGKLFVIILLVFSGLTACNKNENRVLPADYFFIRVPTVTTIAPSNVTPNSADLSYQVIDDGGGTIFESGISWKMPGNTEIKEPLNLTGGLQFGEIYPVHLKDIRPNMTIKYRAYAINERGTSYGEELTLVTSFGTVADVEGNVYQTINIGDQVWMRENLRSATYSDGSSVKGCYCSADFLKYGRHYTLEGLLNGSGFSNSLPSGIQGVCPDGWHVPSDAEWQKLLKYIGVPADELNKFDYLGFNEGGLLKESGTEHWASGNGCNETGFTILPAGVYNEQDQEGSCIQSNFWTCTQFVYFGFTDESQKIIRGYNPSYKCGFSVRCVKD